MLRNTATHSFKAMPELIVPDTPNACADLLSKLTKTYGVVEKIQKVLANSPCKGKQRTDTIKELAAHSHTVEIAFRAARLLDLTGATRMAARNILISIYMHSDLKREAQACLDELAEKNL